MINIVFDTNKIIEEMNLLQLSGQHLFNPKGTTFQIKTIYKMLEEEPAYFFITPETIKKHVNLLNHALSAIYYDQNGMINPALSPQTNNQFKIYNWKAEYLTKPLLDKFFYERIYYYLFQNFYFNKPTVFTTDMKIGCKIQNYHASPLFFPLFIGLIYTLNRSKQSFESTKEFAIEIACQFLTTEGKNNFNPDNLDIDTIKSIYHYCLEKLLPNQLSEVCNYITKCSFTNSYTSYYDNLDLRRITANLPSWIFFTDYCQKEFLSYIIRTWDPKATQLPDNFFINIQEAYTLLRTKETQILQQQPLSTNTSKN